MHRPSLYFTLLILYSTLQITFQSHSEPSQIIEIFRHGARGPLNGYDKSWHNYEWGVLTAAGTRQHYILGKALAKKYPKFFADGYTPRQVYVLSDVTPRCVQSVQAQLDGIFDNQGFSLREDYPKEIAVPPFVDPLIKKTASEINFLSALPSTRLPTLVNIVNSSNAAVFQRNVGAACPNGLHWERHNTHDNKTLDAINNIFKTTLDNINSHIGPKFHLNSTFHIVAFADAMLVNIFDNRTILGNITDPMLIANFTSAMSWVVLHADYGQLHQRQLAAYHTVEALLQQLQAYKKGVLSHRVVLFSGHDYNLYALLAAFGIVTEECLLENFYSFAANQTIPHPTCVFPHFAANIILEFYNHTDQVKFLYNNVVIPICQGKETCDYEEFVFIARNATGNNTLASFQQQCGINVTNTSLTNENHSEEPEETKNTWNEGPEEAKNMIIKEKNLIMGGTSNTSLFIALGVMTVVCLVLLSKVISSRRAYSVLVDEVKERRSGLGLDGDDSTPKGEVELILS